MPNFFSLYLRHIKTQWTQEGGFLDGMLRPVGRRNPFDYMTEDSADRFADGIAECFFFDRKGERLPNMIVILDQYAAELFRSAVLYVYALPWGRKPKTLARVRELFSDKGIWNGGRLDVRKFKKKVLDRMLALKPKGVPLSERTLERLRDGAKRFSFLTEDWMEDAVRLVLDRTLILTDPLVEHMTGSADSDL